MMLDDIERVTLRDGSRIVIRPLPAGDEAAVASWFAGLSPETRYARFFGHLKRLDRRTQSRLAQVDHFRHEAIEAIGPAGETVGMARYIKTDSPGTAEVAIAVCDGWRGRGIAGMLLDRLAARARAAGIETLIAWCLAGNERVIKTLGRLGPTTIGPPDEGIVRLRIDLAQGSRGCVGRSTANR